MTIEETAGGRPLSVLMYSHDGVGLGHMRRNSAIAARLVNEVAEASVLMLVGCPSGLFFDLPEGVDSLKLPSVLKTGTNSWRPRKLGLPTVEIKRLRADLILKTAEVLNPRLFLVDHMPTGIWHELLPTLRHFRSLADPPAVILGLRDILDSPDVVREIWRR